MEMFDEICIGWISVFFSGVPEGPRLENSSLRDAAKKSVYSFGAISITDATGSLITSTIVAP